MIVLAEDDHCVLSLAFDVQRVAVVAQVAKIELQRTTLGGSVGLGMAATHEAPVNARGAGGCGLDLAGDFLYVPDTRPGTPLAAGTLRAAASSPARGALPRHAGCVLASLGPALAIGAPGLLE